MFPDLHIQIPNSKPCHPINKKESFPEGKDSENYSFLINQTVNQAAAVVAVAAAASDSETEMDLEMETDSL